jgi:hypothetical protein
MIRYDLIIESILIVKEEVDSYQIIINAFDFIDGLGFSSSS